MASIRLESVSKSYGGGPDAARGIDLTIDDGELLVLVGPSGSGKSTALRLVAGLERPDAGRIRIDGTDVTDRPPQERDLAMVFQSYALYPHKSVRENLAFGLRMHGASRSRIERRVAEVAAALEIETLLDRRPAQLSGGQRQRVALGRAIAREPKAFLLDEPLSNLDAQLRGQMRAELARIHRRLGATMLYVTHDQEEAMTLGDRIAVMHEGAIQQIGPPMELYRSPATSFVGRFIGSPSMNLVRCSLRRSARGARVEGPAIGFEIEGLDPRDREGREVIVGVRPHDLALVDPKGADATGCVDVVEPLGSEILIHVAAEGGKRGLDLTVAAPPETPAAVDDRVGLRVDRRRIHLFEPDGGRRIH